jgi:hypothetical protein
MQLAREIAIAASLQMVSLVFAKRRGASRAMGFAKKMANAAPIHAEMACAKQQVALAGDDRVEESGIDRVEESGNAQVATEIVSAPAANAAGCALGEFQPGLAVECNIFVAATLVERTMFGGKYTLATQ